MARTEIETLYGAIVDAAMSWDIQVRLKSTIAEKIASGQFVRLTNDQAAEIESRSRDKLHSAVAKLRAFWDKQPGAHLY